MTRIELRDLPAQISPVQQDPLSTGSPDVPWAGPTADPPTTATLGGDSLATPDAGPASRGSNLGIVVVICGTLLLMCSGILGMVYYGINQFSQMVADMEGEWTGEDYSTDAVQYAIAESEEVRERVGAIQSVDVNYELTYSEEAGADEYIYDVYGQSGQAKVVAHHSDRAGRWFDSIQVLEGDALDASRTALTTRPVPFDSKEARTVYEHLLNDASGIEGPIRFIETDWASQTDDDAEHTTFYVLADQEVTVQIEFDELRMVRSADVISKLQ